MESVKLSDYTVPSTCWPSASAPSWPGAEAQRRGCILHQKASKPCEGFFHHSRAKQTRGIKMKLACRFISSAVWIKGLPAPCLHHQPTPPSCFLSVAFKPPLPLKAYFITSVESCLHLTNTAGSEELRRRRRVPFIPLTSAAVTRGHVGAEKKRSKAFV